MIWGVHRPWGHRAWSPRARTAPRWATSEATWLFARLFLCSALVHDACGPRGWHSSTVASPVTIGKLSSPWRHDPYSAALGSWLTTTQCQSRWQRRGGTMQQLIYLPSWLWDVPHDVFTVTSWAYVNYWRKLYREYITQSPWNLYSRSIILILYNLTKNYT